MRTISAISKLPPPKILLVLGFFFLLVGCSGGKEIAENDSENSVSDQGWLASISVMTDSPANAAEPKTDQSDYEKVDVESLIKGMTLREKVGQLFFIPAYGTYRSVDDEHYKHLLEQIKRYHIGGLIFFSSDVYGQAVLTNKLQEVSDIPLWITQDMEYGAAMRVDGTTRFPPAMAVAATGNPDYAYAIGEITAQEAKALGVNQIFAPVLDVNNNPENPVINVRSFSGDPHTVSRFGNRFIDGVQSEGIIATVKHFPGHGDTDMDSHLSLPVIDSDYARIDSVELVPFRSAISNGVKSVMSAHIAFPKIGQRKGLPATMDSTILERILVDSLGFNGMIVTDGLNMHGIASHFSPGEAVVKSLKAGADMMLMSPDELTAIHEIINAVKKGEISESRIDESVRKILRWKKSKGLFDNENININSLSSKINTLDHQLVAQEISRKSLTLVKNDGNILPLRASDYPKITVVSVADNGSGSTGDRLHSLLKQYHPDVNTHILDNRTGAKEKKEIVSDVRDSDLLIIGSFIYTRSGQKVQLKDEHLSFLKKLKKNIPSLLIAFGNPYVVQDLPDTDAQLMAWAANGGQVEATVPALFGGSKIGGRLPITIPKMYENDHGITLPKSTLRHDEPEVAGLSRDSLEKVGEIMNDAVFDSTFPGGIVAVVRNGVIAYEKAFGYQTYKKLEPVRANSIYDLASLTKVTATTPAIMKLVEEGKISLNDKVGKYIPQFRKGKKSSISIKNLLLHNSGLPAYRLYIDKLRTEEKILQAVKNEPLIHKPGTTYEYSDLGFILLGEIIEKVSNMSMDKYVYRTFHYPLGMSGTFFNPSRYSHWVTDRIPPTEIDTTWRNKTIQAEVHDERAFYLDGVAGHAGLFSTAEDLAVYCQMLLNGGSYAGKQYLKPETVKQFTGDRSPQLNRGYGFDRKSDGFSTAGSLTSKQTFGHTGFTGTSFWVDPERDLAIIILTNRTYPHRSYGKNISRIRAKVADAVVSSIIR